MGTTRHLPARNRHVTGHVVLLLLSEACALSRLGFSHNFLLRLPGSELNRGTEEHTGVGLGVQTRARIVPQLINTCGARDISAPECDPSAHQSRGRTRRETFTPARVSYRAGPPEMSASKSAACRRTSLERCRPKAERCGTVGGESTTALVIVGMFIRERLLVLDA